MKKNVFLAFVATSLLMASCASCGDKKPQGLVLETETDSIFMPNDSTVADLQTFIYQGLMPMDNGNSCLLLGTPAVEEGAKQLRYPFRCYCFRVFSL